jgi:Tfp pilus assembly protein PilX
LAAKVSPIRRIACSSRARSLAWRCAVSARRRTSSHIRASTSRNVSAEATTITATSIGCPRSDSIPIATGPISAAAASPSVRPRVSVSRRTGAGSDIRRMEGCSAAAPHST